MVHHFGFADERVVRSIRPEIHVITNRHYSIREIQTFKERYGIGRMDVHRVQHPAVAVRYLCEYLSERRPRCLKRVRLWSAFGRIDRTRVKDVVIDSAMSRLLRGVIGKPSVQQLLAGNETEIRKILAGNELCSCIREGEARLFPPT